MDEKPGGLILLNCVVIKGVVWRIPPVKARIDAVIPETEAFDWSKLSESGRITVGHGPMQPWLQHNTE
jgi:hypothetical protein